MDKEFMKIERTPGGWPYIFQKLYQIAKANAGSQLIAKKPINVTRNRYRDVLPIDSTRVILDDPDNDYINANYVKNEEVGRTYILCQGPLQQTCSHFWQMVWEQNTSGIIMLNKCVERGMNKCYQYWPQPNDKPMELGKFQVEYLSHDDESSYRLSHLKLENTESEESREILHFHYTKWPDFGVPQNPEVFLEFLYAVRSSGVLEPEKGPSVIHCSAGIGRSGTFCIVDTLLAKLEQTQELSSVDLQDTLLDMRQQRLGLVQTQEQLRFSYIAILQGALSDMGLEPSSYEVDEQENDVGEGSGDEDQEDEIEESDSDEIEEDDDDEDDDDDDARMERKFPNLTTRGSTGGPRFDVDDVPPPLPPRPPETLPSYEDRVSSEEDSDENSEASPSLSPSTPPPPPPPTSAPPGPPISPFEQEDDDTANIKMESNLAHSRTLQELSSGDEVEEFGFTLNPSNNDLREEHLENGEVEVLEESCSEDEDEKVMVNPPPIPPRSHSLSPSPVAVPFNSYGSGKLDIYDDTALKSTGPFLLEGRGGEKAPPLQQRLANGIANGETDLPPPLPSKLGRRRSSGGPKLHGIAEEEKMLINELDLLEKLVDTKEEENPLAGETSVIGFSTSPPKELDVVAQPGEPLPPPERHLAEDLPPKTKVPDETLAPDRDVAERRPEAPISEKAAKAKKLREEKRARLDQRVRNLKEAMRKNEGDFESDWSIPWLLVGFVVMLGYCAYYIIQ